MKRAEFVVEAESSWGIERGVNLAIQRIEAGVLDGKAGIPRHGVSVEWRLINVVKATDIEEGGILGKEIPSPGSYGVPGGAAIGTPAQNTPDISTMDIEEAKGIVGTAGNDAELDIMEVSEKSGTRTPGGRKGVLVFIEKRRKEFADKAVKQAESDAKKVADAGATGEAGTGVDAPAEDQSGTTDIEVPKEPQIPNTPETPKVPKVPKVPKAPEVLKAPKAALKSSKKH